MTHAAPTAGVLGEGDRWVLVTKYHYMTSFPSLAVMAEVVGLPLRALQILYASAGRQCMDDDDEKALVEDEKALAASTALAASVTDLILRIDYRRNRIEDPVTGLDALLEEEREQVAAEELVRVARKRKTDRDDSTTTTATKTTTPRGRSGGRHRAVIQEEEEEKAPSAPTKTPSTAKPFASPKRARTDETERAETARPPAPAASSTTPTTPTQTMSVRGFHSMIGRALAAQNRVHGPKTASVEYRRQWEEALHEVQRRLERLRREKLDLDRDPELEACRSILAQSIQLEMDREMHTFEMRTTLMVAAGIFDDSLLGTFVPPLPATVDLKSTPSDSRSCGDPAVQWWTAIAERWFAFLHSAARMKAATVSALEVATADELLAFFRLNIVRHGRLPFFQTLWTPWTTATPSTTFDPSDDYDGRDGRASVAPLFFDREDRPALEAAVLSANDDTHQGPSGPSGLGPSEYHTSNVADDDDSTSQSYRSLLSGVGDVCEWP